jgi:hypothetical protein
MLIEPPSATRVDDVDDPAFKVIEPPVPASAIPACTRMSPPSEIASPEKTLTSPELFDGGEEITTIPLSRGL